MTYIIAILILGVLIIVHELGHMLAGRAAGVKVEEFSINIGPKLPVSYTHLVRAGRILGKMLA